jgi:hypothetical protein
MALGRVTRPTNDSSAIPEGSVLHRSRPGGSQEGRLKPGFRNYKGKVEAVSLDEARSRMSKRVSGELPIIEGGIDDQDDSLIGEIGKDTMSKLPPTTVKPSNDTSDSLSESAPKPLDNSSEESYSAYTLTSTNNFAPMRKYSSFGGFADTEDDWVQNFDPFSPSSSSTNSNVINDYSAYGDNSNLRLDFRGVFENLANIYELLTSVFNNTNELKDRYNTDNADKVDNSPSFIERRTDISIKTSDFTFKVKAICVKNSEYSLSLILPLNTDDVSFVPKVGTEVTISCFSSEFTCFYSGNITEIPELGIVILSFIKNPE